MCSQQGVEWHNNSNFLHEKSIASSLEVREKSESATRTSGNDCLTIANRFVF